MGSEGGSRGPGRKSNVTPLGACLVNDRWPEIVVVCFGVVADALIRDVVAPYA